MGQKIIHPEKILTAVASSTQVQNNYVLKYAFTGIRLLCEDSVLPVFFSDFLNNKLFNFESSSGNDNSFDQFIGFPVR